MRAMREAIAAGEFAAFAAQTLRGEP
jgi:queuine/archaeosine tRNA-ribosyltransferase